MFILAIVSVTPSIVPAQSTLDQNTIRFVADVLCGTEFAENEEKLCSRWAKAPSLSTFGPGSHHPAVIANVVRQLNECLPASNQIKLLEPDNSSANIKVYFVPLAQFPAISKENGFATLDGNLGFFDVRWNAKYEIERATVLIADDKLRGRRLHHFVLEEVTQCFGLAGDSKRIPGSVFYEDRSKKLFGEATRLSDLDKKLIRFLYTHVRPGSQPVELGVALARHWN